MRPEGVKSLLPGEPEKRAWSEGLELHIRNVEAVGSNPITSTQWGRPHSVDHDVGQIGRRFWQVWIFEFVRGEEAEGALPPFCVAEVAHVVGDDDAKIQEMSGYAAPITASRFNAKRAGTR